MISMNKNPIVDSTYKNWSEEEEELKRQQRELEDSIQYASYIQTAIMPTVRDFSKVFPESFIFFQPKNVVSGDFYWFTKRKKEIIIAAADCTGHGVPGAFMSLLGMSFLNEIVSHDMLPTASSILNKLREKVMKALHQTGEGSEQKDGMDIALCIINTEMDELQFAGAFNPLLLFREGKLIELKADRMPIGIHATEELSFTNHTLGLEANDMIYIFTDGFVDQFGGPDGKKFKQRRFKGLLKSTSTRSIKKQEQIVKDTFVDWKGKFEQVDDVLLMGFKYTCSSMV